MARFVYNPLIERQIGVFLIPVLVRATEQVKGTARNIAPVDTGRWRDSFETRITHEKGMPVGQVYSNDRLGHIKEFGSSRTPAHATLAQALDSLRL